MTAVIEPIRSKVDGHVFTNYEIVKLMNDSITALSASDKPSDLQMLAKMTNNNDPQLLAWIQQIVDTGDEEEAQALIEKTLLPLK